MIISFEVLLPALSVTVIVYVPFSVIAISFGVPLVREAFPSDITVAVVLSVELVSLITYLRLPPRLSEASIVILILLPSSLVYVSIRLLSLTLLGMIE